MGVSGSSFNSALVVPGNYYQYYYYTDAYGCSGSDTTSITSEYCTGLVNTMSEPAFTCYPNPATDLVYVSAGNNNSFEIVVMDFAGKTVFSRSNIVSNCTIDLRGFGNGVYLVKCIAGPNVYLQKLMVNQ